MTEGTLLILALFALIGWLAYLAWDSVDRSDRKPSSWQKPDDYREPFE